MLQPNHAALTLCFTDFPDRFYRKSELSRTKAPDFPSPPHDFAPPSPAPGSRRAGTGAGDAAGAARTGGAQHRPTATSFCRGPGHNFAWGGGVTSNRVPTRACRVLALWSPGAALSSRWPLGAIPSWPDGPLAQYRVGAMAPWRNTVLARWPLGAVPVPAGAFAPAADAGRSGMSGAGAPDIPEISPYRDAARRSCRVRPEWCRWRLAPARSRRTSSADRGSRCPARPGQPRPR
jgi:hypothetical protein